MKGNGMYFLGDFIPLTQLAIGQDSAALVVAFAFGIFAYAKQIGSWVFIGIAFWSVGALNMSPENGSTITVLGITGVVLGTVVGCFLVQPAVYIKASTSAGRGSFTYGSNSGPAGFEDVETDVNEQVSEQGSAQFEQQSNSQSGLKPEPESVRDYYALLGVARSANQAGIKLAYRRLMKTCHPDLFPGNKEKEAMAKQVNEAFDVLSDDQKRAAYDRYGVAA